MSNKVRVIDNISEHVLFETTIEKIDTAYDFAKQMESEGLDVRLESISVAQTLLNALGAPSSETEALQNEINQEILSHDSSCCTNSNSLK